MTPFDFVSYPYSHSLLMGVVWGVLFGGAYWLLRRNSPDENVRQASTILGLLVVSHWFLDLIVHRPDLPLYPGGVVNFGFGLWRSVIGTVIVEVAIFAIGFWVYMTSTRPLDRIGRYAIWGLVALLGVAYVGDLLGPVPTDVKVVMYAAYIGSAVTFLLAWWADRHRRILPPRAVRRQADGATKLADRDGLIENS